MSGSLNLRGTLEVNGQNCVTSCPPGSTPDRHTLGLSLGECPTKIFETICECPTPLRIATSGAVGQNFEDVPLLEEFTAIEFLMLQTNAEIIARINAAAATLLGVGGVFPTTFVGAETFNFTVDGTAIAVIFTAAAQAAQDVVNEINAAAALLGLTAMPARVDTSGQIALTGVLTGTAGTVVVTGGTGAATIGFPATPSAVGGGDDVRVQGLAMIEFPRFPNAPTRIQLSGVAQVEILAAGRSAA